MFNEIIEANKSKIIGIAEANNIRELYIFGSILREDFSEASDIDLLISLDKKVKFSLLELLELKHKFEEIFLRSVDLIEKESIKNPYRKAHILRTARKLYAVN